MKGVKLEGAYMTETQKNQYLHRLETMTMEYQVRHGQRSWRRSEAPSKRSQSSDGIRVIRAESCFDRETHFIHLKKHSDVYAGQVPVAQHRHDFFEFNFICCGTCHNLLGEKQLLCGPDQLLLMNPKAAHVCWVDDIESQVVNLLLRPEIVDHVFLNLLSADDPIARFFLDSLYGQNSMPDYLLFQINEKVMDIFWNLVDEFVCRRQFYEQVMLSEVLKLFAELLRLNPMSQPTVTKNTGQANDILEYMKRHYTNVSLSELSEIFHYSSVYISRILKKETGKSFSELLIDYRLSRACNFLKNSNISSENISEIIGYSDVSYFYKIFKREFHMNPSEYRKKYWKQL